MQNLLDFCSFARKLRRLRVLLAGNWSCRQWWVGNVGEFVELTGREFVTVLRSRVHLVYLVSGLWSCSNQRSLQLPQQAVSQVSSSSLYLSGNFLRDTMSRDSVSPPLSSRGQNNSMNELFAVECTRNRWQRERLKRDWKINQLIPLFMQLMAESLIHQFRY